MNDDTDNDELKRFEEVGRKLFQTPKPEITDDEEAPDSDEPTDDE